MFMGPLGERFDGEGSRKVHRDRETVGCCLRHQLAD